MLNKAMIIGRLGREPELKYTQSGMPVTTLNIATDESYLDRDGNRVEKTEWHRVSVFSACSGKLRPISEQRKSCLRGRTHSNQKMAGPAGARPLFNRHCGEYRTFP